MIKLGFHNVGILSNSGINIENYGSIIFRGSCIIGNDSFITVGPQGVLDFGPNFIATGGLKVVAWNKISFGHDCLVGWQNLFTDNDFHKMVTPTNEITNPIGEIRIGDNNWFALKCTTLKDTRSGAYCSFGACSLINSDFGNIQKAFICGIPAKLKKQNYYYDKSLDT